MSARCNATSGSRARAMASMSAEMSMPITSKRSFNSARYIPVPQPASSTVAAPGTRALMIPATCAARAG